MATRTPAVLDPALEERRSFPPVPPSADSGPPRPRRTDTLPPPVSNARLAMLAFIVFESMLFAGLLGGYVTLRWGSASWPPAGQPYLPLAITWLNTLCLLGSCVPLHLASRGFRMSNLRPFTRADSPSSPSVARDLRPPIRLLVLAACMGGVFLGIQGYEWARLLAHGMTIARGTYGGLFLILIGTHGAHVLAAVLWLAIVALLAAAGRITPARRAVLDISTMYWYFVCAVWIVLFTLVYLA